MQLAGTSWGNMSEKEKAPWTKVAENDKLRYQKQVEMLSSKGFFMLKDGTKSNDPANAHLIKVKREKSKAG